MHVPDGSNKSGRYVCHAPRIIIIIIIIPNVMITLMKEIIMKVMLIKIKMIVMIITIVSNIKMSLNII